MFQITGQLEFKIETEFFRARFFLPGLFRDSTLEFF